MDKSKLILKVKSYLNNLPEEIFDKNYLTTASVFCRVQQVGELKKDLMR